MRIFSRDEGKASCSFCGKSHDQIDKLVAGPAVYICDSCINTAKRLVDEVRGIASTSADDIRERINLLNGLFETKDITREEHDKKLRELMARL